MNKINTRNEIDKLNININVQSNQILKIKIIQTNHKLNNNDENNTKKEKNNEIPKNKEFVNNNLKSLVMNNNKINYQ